MSLADIAIHDCEHCHRPVTDHPGATMHGACRERDMYALTLRLRDALEDAARTAKRLCYVGSPQAKTAKHVNKAADELAEMWCAKTGIAR